MSEAKPLSLPAKWTEHPGVVEDLTALRDALGMGDTVETADVFIAARECIAEARDVVEKVTPFLEMADDIKAAHEQNKRSKCVYCGAENVGGGVSATWEERGAAFKAHLVVCPSHPIREAEKQVAALRAGLVAADAILKPDANGAGAVWDDVLVDTAAVAARYVEVDSAEFRAQLESLFDVAVLNADAIKAGHGGSACFVDGTLLALRGTR